MGHLVDDDPVMTEFGLGDVAADDDPCGRAAIAERRAFLYAPARRRHDQEPQRRYRKLAVINRDRLGRLLDPGDEGAARQCELARGECDIEGRAPNLDWRRGQTVEGLIRKALAGELGLSMRRKAR